MNEHSEDRRFDVPQITQPYYADDHVTIYHGDALSVLPQFVSELVDVVILDPPYSFEPTAVRGRDDGAAASSGAPTMLLHRTLVETQRILRPGGIAPILHQWRRTPDVAYMMALVGLRLTSCVAWTRSRIGTGGLFRSSWDPILVGAKGAPTLRDKAAIPNVVHVEPLSGQPHPYAKPPALWGHFLQRVPRPAVVLDPYMGLGAAGVAARAQGFRFIGVESDERYCEMAATRLAQVLDMPVSCVPEVVS